MLCHDGDLAGLQDPHRGHHHHLHQQQGDSTGGKSDGLPGDVANGDRWGAWCMTWT